MEKKRFWLVPVTYPSIKIVSRLEFEDGFSKGVLPLEATGAIAAATPSPGSIQNSSWVQVRPWSGMVVIWNPDRPNSNLLGLVNQRRLNHSCYVVFGLNRPRR